LKVSCPADIPVCCDLLSLARREVNRKLKSLLDIVRGSDLDCALMSIKTIDINQTPPIEKLLAQVVAGDEVVFEADGKPIARLVSIDPAAPRVAGLREGQGWMSEDFDAPLPDEFWAGRV
jgi:antitoxin (DNA-binding transcriptional repressor) of toxin-antitoxin stability system